MKWSFFVCFAIVCVGVQSLQSDLNDLLVGPKCGQKTCKFLEYCNEYQSTCESCSIICNTSNHNFDKSACQNSCQDYLKDVYYDVGGLRDYLKEQHSGTDPSLKASVDKLYILVIVTLVLVIILYIRLIASCVVKLVDRQNGRLSLKSIRQRFFSRRNKSDSAEMDKTPNNVKTGNKKPAELRIEIGNPGLRNSSSDDSPYTISTNLSRKPAEDSALDYAYENHAMSTATPSPR